MTSTFAPESWSRAATAGVAKPEKMGTWTAPMCAHAWDATATAGAIGMKIATRSPGSTPSATSASANRVTFSESCANVHSARSPFSPRRTAATVSGVRRAQSWTHARATLIFPPTNQVAHSGPRDSSRRRSHGCENSIPMSSIAAGQNQSGSSCERRTSSQ